DSGTGADAAVLDRVAERMTERRSPRGDERLHERAARAGDRGVAALRRGARRDGGDPDQRSCDEGEPSLHRSSSPCPWGSRWYLTRQFQPRSDGAWADAV